MDLPTLAAHPCRNPYADDGQHELWRQHEERNYRALYHVPDNQPVLKYQLLGESIISGRVSVLMFAAENNRLADLVAWRWYALVQLGWPLLLVEAIEDCGHQRRDIWQQCAEMMTRDTIPWDSYRALKLKAYGLAERAHEMVMNYYAAKRAQPGTRQLVLLEAAA